MSRLNVLFAVHDWGLGHATRDLVLIRGLLDAGHAVTVLSNGRALELLGEELGGECELLQLGDIPKPLGRKPFWFYLRMSLAMPLVLAIFARERDVTRRLVQTRGFDRVISDSRFGVVSRDVPSYYLFHSLRQIIPKPFDRLESFVERRQRDLLRHATGILIPDVEEDGGLAGALCHDPACDWRGKLHYLGILSSLRRRELSQDIDFFVSVSGAEPQRTFFEEIVLAQAHDLPGRTVVALGRAGSSEPPAHTGRVTIYPYLDRRRQEEMMNRARLVVSRSGYTTLMELAELRRRALFVPTVGQSEQEYLAAHHRAKGHAFSVAQSELRLARDTAIALRYRGLPVLPPTQTSVARFLAIIGG